MDDTDPNRERRVADDAGPVREWADETGAVPVRTGRAQGESDQLALVGEDEADDHERIDWTAFADVLDTADLAVVYDDSGDVEGLDVVHVDDLEPGAVRYEETDRASYEEREEEGKAYAGHEMRGVGAPAAEAGEGRPEEGTRETRPDRDGTPAASVGIDDVGKTVVDEEGTELGVVAQASGEDGAVPVDVAPGVTERILSKLGWTGETDVDYRIPAGRIRRVTDERVVLASGDVETAGES